MKTIEEIRTLAGHVAAEMLALANAKETPPATGGGSRHRGLPEELRRKWKVQRDCSRRGYTTDQVLDELDRREHDSVSFIRPQQRFADIVVSFNVPDGRVDHECVEEFGVYFECVAAARASGYEPRCAWTGPLTLLLPTI